MSMTTKGARAQRRGTTGMLVNTFAHILKHIYYDRDRLTRSLFRFWCLTSFCNQVLRGSGWFEPRPIMLVCERRASSPRLRPTLEEGAGCELNEGLLPAGTRKGEASACCVSRWAMEDL